MRAMDGAPRMAQKGFSPSATAWMPMPPAALRISKKRRNGVYLSMAAIQRGYRIS